MKTRCLTFAFLLFYSFTFAQVEKLVNSNQLLFGPQNVDRVLASQKSHYIEMYSLLAEELNEEIAELESEVKVIAVNSARKNKAKKIKTKAINRLLNDLAVLEHYIELWAATPITNTEKITEFYQQYNESACYKINTPTGVLNTEEFQFVEYTSSTHFHEIIPISISTEKGEWVRKKKSPNCFSQNPDDCYVACWVIKKVNMVTIKQGRMALDFDACPVDFELSKDETHCFRTIELEQDDTNVQNGLSLINLNNGTAILDIDEWTTISCQD